MNDRYHLLIVLIFLIIVLVLHFTLKKEEDRMKIKDILWVIGIFILGGFVLAFLILFILGVESLDDYLYPRYGPLFSERTWEISLILPFLLLFFPAILAIPAIKNRFNINFNTVKAIYIGLGIFYLLFFLPATNLLCKRYKYGSCLHGWIPVYMFE